MDRIDNQLQTTGAAGNWVPSPVANTNVTPVPFTVVPPPPGPISKAAFKKTFWSERDEEYPPPWSWAIANRIFNSSYISTVATNAINDATISVSTPIWQCGCPSSTGVTPTGSYDPVSATCTTNCGSSNAGLYLTVTTQATYNSLVPYGLFSGANATRTLTASDGAYPMILKLTR